VAAAQHPIIPPKLHAIGAVVQAQAPEKMQWHIADPTLQLQVLLQQMLFDAAP